MSSASVLLIVRRPVVLEDAAALVREMLRDARFSPIVICPSPSLAAQLEDAVGHALRFVDYAGREVRPLAAKALQGAVGGGGRMSSLSRSSLARTAATLARLFVYRIRAARLFRRFPAGLLVVFEDRAPYPEMVFLAQARRTGAKALLVSYAASSVESDATSRRERPEHLIDERPWRTLKRLLARRYPHQAMHTRFGRMLFFGHPDTLALACSGLLQGCNWHYGGGAVDLCTKISRDDLELARSEGAPVDRFVVTGQPMMDAMYEARANGRMRERLAHEHSLRPGRRLIVCAVPHSAEHGLVDWDSHLAQTRELFFALSASEADVLLSLHPRSRVETYQGLAAAAGCTILKARLSTALPAADIFVASYSSTVRWALAMGIPAIMADFPQFGYEQFANLPGSIVVRDAPGLERALGRLVSDERELERMSREAAGGAGSAQFDGKVCARIMQEMARLADERK